MVVKFTNLVPYGQFFHLGSFSSAFFDNSFAVTSFVWITSVCANWRKYNVQHPITSKTARKIEIYFTGKTARF